MFKTTFTITILSEEKISGIKLEDINYFVTEGHGVLHTFDVEKEEALTPKEMAFALYDAGSEPGFFQLDKDGNKVDN